MIEELKSLYRNKEKHQKVMPCSVCLWEYFDDPDEAYAPTCSYCDEPWPCVAVTSLEEDINTMWELLEL